MKCLSLLLAFFLFITPVHAQETEGAKSAISDADISELLQTLEDPAAREDFINKLKTINEAKDQIEGEDGVTALADKLNLDKKTYRFIETYEDFLEQTGLQGSTVGKIALTALVIFITFVLLFIVKKLGVLLRNKALSLTSKIGLQHGRLRLYSRFLRYMAYTLIVLLSIYTMNVVWDFADMSFLQGEMFAAIFARVFSILLIVLLAVAVWEGVNAVLDNILHRADYKESMRLQTVMPIIRNVIFIGFMVMFTLILLSELGINVIPLMAGAGVLGIAIGFGAQTMVKDFLTGFTIILEDLIQVGDVVTLGGKTGLIEKITIRKVQMRDLSGIVYTIPFGDVTIIENMTKNFSYYVMDIGVAYREDTDEVVALLREIDEDMRQDENFKNLILEPIEILGVDAFADSAVIIKARIKTRPIKQWDVGREFNRRMKYKFDEHGIEIPFPHQTIYFGVDKDGTAPPAPIKIEKETG
jgi:small conductance mechanosensitive channel